MLRRPVLSLLLAVSSLPLLAQSERDAIRNEERHRWQ